MRVRHFRADDARALAELSASCSRSEADFVLNPLWENEEEMSLEFSRHDADPEESLWVADVDEAAAVGMAGFLRPPDESEAALICPIVHREQRGRGLGGELLRAALARAEDLGIKLASAGIGTRNRAGYSLLTAHGFRPVRQSFLMRCVERPDTSALPPPGLEFGPTTAADLPSILQIYAESGFEAREARLRRELLEEGRHAHAVARRGDRIVAFADLESHWPRRVWVAFLSVNADARNRGVGSALMAWALAQRFDAGAESALLLLSGAHRTALRACEKVGFRRLRMVDVLERRF